MKQRKAIILFLTLVILGPLAIFLFIQVTINMSEKRIDIKESITSYFDGIPYTSKQKYYDMLQDFSVFNYHETFPIYEKDDRIYGVIFDDSSSVRKNVDILGKNGKFEYLLNSNSGINLEYKENYLTKTTYHYLSHGDFNETFNNSYEESVNTDFDTFLNYTLIRGYIDFSNAKITKTKIDADEKNILVEGVLGSKLSLGIGCLAKYVEIDNPRFSFQASYYDSHNQNEINPYVKKDIRIYFQSNSKYELDSEIIIKIYRK